MLLDHSEIHLWLSDQADFELAELEANCLPWLSVEDSQRYKRLLLERHRKQMLLGRFLVRTVLSKYSESVEPGDWHFTQNAYGKPALDQQQHPLSLFFNLSHSQGKLVVAVSRNEFLGVDIEASTRPRRIARIASRYFSAAEVTALLAMPRPLQLDRFYQLWTLKEAYIKACGLGLAIPLRHFSYEFLNDLIDIRFDPELDDDVSAWRFWQVDAGPAHQLALALKQEQLVQSARNSAPINVLCGSLSGRNTAATPALVAARIHRSKVN